MSPARFRKSAVAMMIVAGGLAAAAPSSAQPAAAPKDKGSQTAIPCNLTPKDKRAQKKAGARPEKNMGPLGYKKKGGIVNPCEAKKRRGSDKLGDIK